MTPFLLTGASGFIGNSLAKLLLSRGHAVRALVRRTSSRVGLEGVSFVEGDLATGAGLEAAVEGVEVVMHLAGLTKARTPEEYHLANAEGTRRLAAAAAAQAKPPRFVYCSSLAAAGPSRAGHPKTEEDTEAPISTYGRSKLAGEMALRAFADRLHSVILRPAIVYGPADREFLPSLLPMAKMGVMLKSGFGSKHYSLVHVDDLCEALYAAAHKGAKLDPLDSRSGVYFVSDDVEYTWEQVCFTLADAMGKRRPRVVALPDAFSYAAGLGGELQAKLRGTVAIINRDKAREMRAEAWTCSPARAKREIEYHPRVALRDGMQGALAWYRKEGML
jgi:nucleoside-diphosphate-sugar epimerase